MNIFSVSAILERPDIHVKWFPWLSSHFLFLLQEYSVLGSIPNAVIIKDLRGLPLLTCFG